MIYTFHCAHSHLEMLLNDIILVSVMVSDAYTIIDTNPIPPKMADTDIHIWYQCILIDIDIQRPGKVYRALIKFQNQPIFF